MYIILHTIMIITQCNDNLMKQKDWELVDLHGFKPIPVTSINADINDTL